MLWMKLSVLVAEPRGRFTQFAASRRVGSHAFAVVKSVARFAFPNQQYEIPAGVLKVPSAGGCELVVQSLRSRRFGDGGGNGASFDLWQGVSGDQPIRLGRTGPKNDVAIPVLG